MAINDELGKRMKENYENVSKTRLLRRTPVAIRIDGKAFHTFTRGFDKPFDKVLMKSMQQTMQYLCENIQGCVFGFTQSDEITLILVDYKKLNSSAWFDYSVQKMCSIAASMATMAFNKYFDRNCLNDLAEKGIDNATLARDFARKQGAMFDARCFNIPKEEVCNLIYWRQADAARNSVQMVGRAYFSHKALQGLNNSQIQDKLMLECNVNWNDIETCCKRGSACIKVNDKWIVDEEMPLLVNDNREYVNKLVYCEEE